MFSCKIENTKGAVLTLTQNESAYQVYNITGLGPPSAKINTSNVAGLDGAKFNSAKLETRNIVIYIKLNGEIEKNRIRLYSYFPTKEWCNFFYKNNSLDVHIEGYVESVEVTPFTDQEELQVSIICPDPYFKALDEIIDDISKVSAAFDFPFAINLEDPVPISTLDISKVTDVYNASESSTGVIIEVDVLGAVDKLLIQSVSTGETFQLVYAFVADDRILINTRKSQKSITLVRDGVEHNIFTAIVKGSTFFQLSLGDNYFSYTVNDDANDENLVNIVFRHYNVYRGV